MGVDAYLSDQLLQVDKPVSWRIVVIVCLTLGPLIGLFNLYLSAGLIRWTGRWIGGRARREQLQTAVAWSFYPSAVLLFVTIPLFAYRIIMDVTGVNALPASIGIPYDLLSTVILIWAAVILVVGVAEVQKFSIGKAVLNCILPRLVIVLPFMIVGGLIWFITLAQ